MMPGFAEVPPGALQKGCRRRSRNRASAFSINWHEALRTRVVTTADRPLQIIDPASAEAVAVRDVSSVADPVAATRCPAEASHHRLTSCQQCV